jgi:hypothetical protein
MARRDTERGATLILVIGVVAALAILSSAMVALAVNVQHNTSTDRQQTTAFHVAEAGVDAIQSAMWTTWPRDAASLNAMRGQVPASLAGGTITWQVYDDDGGKPLGIVRSRQVDDPALGTPGVMWIEATGTYGRRSAKVMVAVQQVEFPMNVRGNVAIFGAGNMTLNGSGSQPVVAYEGGASGASAYVRGNYTSNGNTVLAPGVVLNPDNDVTIPDILPDETLLALMRNASAAGKVYATQAAVPAAAWSTQPRIVVIETGDVNLKDIPNTDGSTVWTEDNPGVLIALDPNGRVYISGQTKTFYGILYAMGSVDISGNAEWHGMILANGTVTLSGTRSIVYNPTVIANLTRPMILAVQQVPNTWRELSAY